MKNIESKILPCADRYNLISTGVASSVLNTEHRFKISDLPNHFCKSNFFLFKTSLIGVC